jgi:hypothetical protein
VAVEGWRWCELELPTAGSLVHMAYTTMPVCVCTSPHGAQLRAAGCAVAVCCSTVVDAAKNSGRGAQAHSSHVGGCVTSKPLSTLSTLTAAAQQNTRHILPRVGTPGQLREASGELYIDLRDLAVCELRLRGK